jgi:hypothetical protein
MSRGVEVRAGQRIETTVLKNEMNFYYSRAGWLLDIYTFIDGTPIFIKKR